MRPPPSALPPWRLFFPAAALWGGLVVVLTEVGMHGAWAPAGPWGLTRWHAHEMIWGHVLAAFAGVLLTALPRWTGCAPMPPKTTLTLAGLWLVARIAALTDGTGLLLLASPLFVAALALVAARRIVASGDRRDAPLVGLLLVLALADGLTILGGEAPLGDLGLRLGLAGMIAIAAVMGGRVAPALTRHLQLTAGRTLDVAVPPVVEGTVAAVTFAALTAWVFAAPPAVTSALLAAAALVHLVRLAHWKGWTSGHRPSILALHLGYACIALGFALTAWAEIGADPRLVDAGRHAWGVGVFGLLCFAVQTSVVRRHTGRPLSRDRLADLGCAALATALAARLTAAATAGDGFLIAAVAAWLVAATLLVVAAAARPQPRPR